MAKTAIPQEFDRVRALALRSIRPIKPADSKTKAEKNFLFSAQRTNAGRDLPPYHLVYFLLVDLLKFRDLGRFEKVAWSVPIDFEGTAYLIEHRKFGLGLFASDAEGDAPNAKRIVGLIRKGVDVAQPFFRWKADEAVRRSQFNVINKGYDLFQRYRYLCGQYESVLAEAQARKEECVIERTETPQGTCTTYHRPSFELFRNAGWLAMAAIDAFFAWTEHIFIHLAILQAHITSGAEVSELVGAEWKAKFKRALDIDDPDMKVHFDELIIIRRQFRNFVAHGAFGKGGEAYRFHSSAGAVPVAFDYTSSKPRFSLSPELAFDDAQAIAAIERFIAYLWSGPREAARLYIQESGLPLILTMAQDGTYKAAMSSVEDMSELVAGLSREADDSANMDW